MYHFKNYSFSIIRLTLVFIVFSLSINVYAQDTAVTKPKIGTVQAIGDVILIALPVATLSTSFIIGDEKGAWQFTKGLILTEALTYGLKAGINKPRPDNSNDNSFPSGHTSTTFHSAGFIHKRYGLKYAIPAYALAGFTAASRIDSRKHDILDVLAGAAIGLGSNVLFTTEYAEKNIKLTYISEQGDHMVGFTYKF